MRAFPPITPSGPPQVVWFKRDLRVEDHAALAHASAAGPVLCVYAVELEHWHQPCISDRQWQFVRECLLIWMRNSNRWALRWRFTLAPVIKCWTCCTSGWVRSRCTATKVRRALDLCTRPCGRRLVSGPWRALALSTRKTGWFVPYRAWSTIQGALGCLGSCSLERLPSHLVWLEPASDRTGVLSRRGNKDDRERTAGQ